MDYDRFFVENMKNCRVSDLRRAVTTAMKYEDIISLGTGMPNPSLFPVQEMTFKMVDGKELVTDAKTVTRIVQYPGAEGFPDLKNWLEEFHFAYHKPPFARQKSDVGVVVTNGAQGGMDLIFRSMLGPADAVMVEKPCYSGGNALLNFTGCQKIGVQCDEQGIKPIDLAQQIEAYRKAKGEVPKMIYTVPTGHNPLGCSTLLERKREIYQVAQKYDMLIVEDDPYHFLQYNDKLTPSYQSIDEDGRVVRIDSASKIIAAGMRCGWISGHQGIIKRLWTILTNTILGTGHMEQAFLGMLLNNWGLDGFWRHIDEIRSFYRKKRNMAEKAARKHLSDLATWQTPHSGLFVWFTLKDLDDSSFLFTPRTFEKGVLVIPGRVFSLYGESSKSFRLTFSIGEEETFDEGLRRLADVIRSETSRLKSEKNSSSCNHRQK